KLSIAPTRIMQRLQADSDKEGLTLRAAKVGFEGMAKAAVRVLVSRDKRAHGRWRRPLEPHRKEKPFQEPRFRKHEPPRSAERITHHVSSRYVRVETNSKLTAFECVAVSGQGDAGALTLSVSATIGRANPFADALVR